jgi:hypothetical protein
MRKGDEKEREKKRQEFSKPTVSRAYSEDMTTFFRTFTTKTDGMDGYGILIS